MLRKTLGLARRIDSSYSLQLGRSSDAAEDLVDRGLPPVPTSCQLQLGRSSDAAEDRLIEERYGEIVRASIRPQQ